MFLNRAARLSPRGPSGLRHAAEYFTILAASSFRAVVPPAILLEREASGA